MTTLLHMLIEEKSCISSLLLLSIFLIVNSVIAMNTISPGQSLSGNQTIVSQGYNFELGFFTPTNSSKEYYLGIWYKKVSEKTIVWVANREKPIFDPYSVELMISDDGNLVLIDHSKVIIWSTNSSSSTSKLTLKIAVLLDTGNLVLRDHLDPSTLLWQSFDHPTDTWVHESHIGMNKITGEYHFATSWRNRRDPSPGLFSHGLDPNGTNQYVLLWNRSVKYWTSGEWNGRFFNLMPEMGLNNIFNFSFIENNQSKFFTYTAYNSSFITRTVMDSSGILKQFAWVYDTQKWMLYWSQPLAQCDVYSLCGSFGVCDQKTSPPCNCLQGFKPGSSEDWELDNWSGGCMRKTPLNCGTNISHPKEKDGFLMMTNKKLPVNPNEVAVGNRAECEITCLGNCSCVAYAYVTTCMIWSGKLQNLQQLPDGDPSAETLYLRLAYTDQPKSNNKTKMTILTIVSVSIAAVAALCSILWFRERCPRPKTNTRDAYGSLVPFTYVDLQNMTNNFSEKLGSGSFGSVFKGVMPDSTVIAVKKLEGLRQGEKQFRAEVRTLGTIHHVNLVGLRGFCSEKTKMLLVYDYMPNGSLDYHLFRNNPRVLEWRTRYQIILGIARGLSYIHEKCREYIIHCDIKPENILLDSEFQPRISDFGMAKLVGRDFSRVLTSMRGTIGYLAPEWISGLAITNKVDVYSFGMLVMEIISGKRNTEKSMEGIIFFPIWAATKVNQGDFLSLLDQKLDNNVDLEELSRVCKIACWCIQDNELHRPPMGLVVQALEGLQEVNVPPIPQSLRQLIECQSTSPPSTSSHI